MTIIIRYGIIQMNASETAVGFSMLFRYLQCLSVVVAALAADNTQATTCVAATISFLDDRISYDRLSPADQTDLLDGVTAEVQQYLSTSGYKFVYFELSSSGSTVPVPLAAFLKQQMVTHQTLPLRSAIYKTVERAIDRFQFAGGESLSGYTLEAIRAALIPKILNGGSTTYSRPAIGP